MATRTIAFRLNDKNREDKEIMEWLDKNCSDDMGTVIKIISDCAMGERKIHG